MIASKSRKMPDLHSCWNDVLSMADDDESGAHIFAYHLRENEHRYFNQEMRNRHRLVWMDRATLRNFGSERYTETLEKHVEFESQWRNKIRPRNTSAAPLLPETSFVPKSRRDMWRRIRAVCLNNDDLGRVKGLIDDFRQIHYKRGGYWEDDRGIQFKVDPGRHGSFPPYGRFKFTFCVPEGFHYDVGNSRQNRGFSVNNAEGVICQFDRYTNIDCHGSVRGGT